MFEAGNVAICSPQFFGGLPESLSHLADALLHGAANKPNGVQVVGHETILQDLYFGMILRDRTLAVQ